jgi:hypothetical protein
MAGSFVKVFGSILTSSVWCEDDATVRVWLTMLVLADAEGKVWGAVPGVARVAGVSADAGRAAIAKLCDPDPDSRTPDEEGRRLLPIDGGWVVVNARKYREMQTDGQRKASLRSKRYRDSRKPRVTERDVRDATRPSRTEEEREPEPEGRTENELRAAARRPRRKSIKTGVDRNDSPEARAVIDMRYKILEGDPDATAPKLKAASRAIAAGLGPEKLRQVFEAIRDARDAPDNRSLAAFCARQNRTFEYSVRPEVAQKILDEITTPTGAAIVHHPSSPRHTFPTRPERNRAAAEAFMRKAK